MSRLIKKIGQAPIHLLLLPLYFIVHKTFQFRGLLDASETLKAFGLVLAGTAALFGLFYLFYRNGQKAAAAATATAALYLFFGDIKYSFSGLPVLHHLSHYKVLLPLLALSLLLLYYYLKKKKQVLQLGQYLTLLLLIYFAVDIVSGSKLNKRSQRITLAPEKLQAAQMKNRPQQSPTIYYLLTDGYPAPAFQQEVLGMKGPSLDSLLALKGFHIISRGRSNYSNTAFSMASVFGMNYLAGIDTAGSMAPYHYNRCMEMVEHSPFIDLIKQAGYRIHNLSIFDLDGQPAIEKDRFLSSSTRAIIFYSTLYDCIRRDLFWQLIPGYLDKINQERFLNRQTLLNPQKAYNRAVTDSIRHLSTREGTGTPAFVYLHLKMPHFPYFYDSAGRAYAEDTVYAEPLIADKLKFAGYIQYTNKQLDTIVSGLIKQHNGQAVIIVQSDHGWDDFTPGQRAQSFRNFTAFYFPDQDYHLLYDSLSNVNTFRVLLNKYFNQGLPLLPDRSYYLK